MLTSPYQSCLTLLSLHLFSWSHRFCFNQFHSIKRCGQSHYDIQFEKQSHYACIFPVEWLRSFSVIVCKQCHFLKECPRNADAKVKATSVANSEPPKIPFLKLRVGQNMVPRAVSTNGKSACRISAVIFPQISLNVKWQLVSRYFEPSQPLRIISGLETNLIFHLVIHYAGHQITNSLKSTKLVLTQICIIQHVQTETSKTKFSKN